MKKNFKTFQKSTARLSYTEMRFVKGGNPPTYDETNCEQEPTPECEKDDGSGNGDGEGGGNDGSDLRLADWV